MMRHQHAVPGEAEKRTLRFQEIGELAISENYQNGRRSEAI